MSLKEARPRDLLERMERDSSLSLDLDVSLGTISPPGCDIDPDFFGDRCLREKKGAHAGDKPFEEESFGVEGVLVDMISRDMGV